MSQMPAAMERRRMLESAACSQIEREFFFDQVFPLNLRGVKRLLAPGCLALLGLRQCLQAESSEVREASLRALRT
jgi:hypothetical protein